jgi:glucose-6-phosphate 1-epimerase
VIADQTEPGSAATVTTIACEPATGQAGDGTSLTACRHGGQLLGWRPAGAARDLLWLSPRTGCGPGVAIRGGVPVIFPQFSGRGSLPRHGLARDRAWQDLEFATGQDHVRVRARLRDDAATRAVWPHAFTLSLEALARGAELCLTLQVRHDCAAAAPGAAPEPAGFTAALHTYLAVADADRAQVLGLAGALLERNADGSTVTSAADALAARGPLDLAVRDHARPVILDGGDARIEVTREHFADLVIWNPGPGHGLADVPDGGERRFVCVEAAQLSTVQLAPGADWTAQVRYRLLTA